MKMRILSCPVLFLEAPPLVFVFAIDGTAKKKKTKKKQKQKTNRNGLGIASNPRSYEVVENPKERAIAMAAIGSRRLADRLANRRLPIAAVARNLRFEFVVFCFFLAIGSFFYSPSLPTFANLMFLFFLKKFGGPGGGWARGVPP